MNTEAQLATRANIFTRTYRWLVSPIWDRWAEREQDRRDELYGAFEPIELPSRLELDTQLTRLTRSVRGYSSHGQAICDLHATATRKLDAAEYAFSSMLDELRDVMQTLPTDWAPQHTTTPRPLAEPIAITALAA